MKTVIALGYFDSVHLGHREVIKSARKIADSLGCELAVFTFDGNLRGAIDNGDFIYGKHEREIIYKKLGVDKIYFAETSKEFLSLKKEKFLDFINGVYDICAYVCGKDYRFGLNAEGDADFLAQYSQKHGQSLTVISTVCDKSEKISTTKIKEYLLFDIKKANELLGENYFAIGKVVGGSKIGKSLGYKTANLEVEKDKARLKRGVYSGRVIVQDKTYKAMINYGACPTFGKTEDRIEAHLLNFDKEIYGKEITVIFDRFIREIKKFNDKNELISQLKKDYVEVKND